MRPATAWILVLFAALLSGCVTTTHSEVPSTTKEEDIRTLLEITGAADMGIQVMTAMMENLRPLAPDVPAEYWDQIAGSVSGDDLVDLVVPIYDRHYERQEIRDAIAFYSSPSGKAMIAKMPEVMKESMEVGQAWGKRLAEEIIQRLQEDGFLKPTHT